MNSNFPWGPTVPRKIEILRNYGLDFLQTGGKGLGRFNHRTTVHIDVPDLTFSKSKLRTLTSLKIDTTESYSDKGHTVLLQVWVEYPTTLLLQGRVSDTGTGTLGLDLSEQETVRREDSTEQK